jgi:hypothetical protein
MCTRRGGEKKEEEKEEDEGRGGEGDRLVYKSHRFAAPQ